MAMEDRLTKRNVTDKLIIMQAIRLFQHPLHTRATNSPGSANGTNSSGTGQSTTMPGLHPRLTPEPPHVQALGIFNDDHLQHETQGIKDSPTPTIGSSTLGRATLPWKLIERRVLLKS